MAGYELKVLNRYTSSDWRKAGANKRKITGAALSALGHRDIPEFLGSIRRRTATVIFLAGAAKRWTESVQGAKARGEAANVDITKARCLAPVPDVLHKDLTVPLGLYNLRAIAGIGTPVLVYRRNLLDILYMARQAKNDFAMLHYQSAPINDLEPLGHGDAFRQLLPLLAPNIEYLVTVFGGDVTYRDTVITSLLTQVALQQLNARNRPAGLIPVTCLREAKYPIMIGNKGLPLQFGHKKLTGAEASDKTAPSNVGLRIYTRADVQAVVNSVVQRHYDPLAGYNIPGNKTNEFALDNIDQILARDGRIRVLNISSNEEIDGSVKTWEDIPKFLEAQSALLNSAGMPYRKNPSRTIARLP